MQVRTQVAFSSQAELEDRLEKISPSYRAFGPAMWKAGIRESKEISETTDKRLEAFGIIDMQATVIKKEINLVPG